MMLGMCTTHCASGLCRCDRSWMSRILVRQDKEDYSATGLLMCKTKETLEHRSTGVTDERAEGQWWCEWHEKLCGWSTPCLLLIRKRKWCYMGGPCWRETSNMLCICFMPCVTGVAASHDFWSLAIPCLGTFRSAEWTDLAYDHDDLICMILNFK